MNNAQQLALIISLAASTACGANPGRGGSDDPIEMPGETVDRVVVSIDSVSSTNDCDSTPGNPGDFTSFVQVYVKDDINEFGMWNLVEASEPTKFSLNAEKGERKTKALNDKITLELPRVDGQAFLVQVHAIEKDSATTEDAHLTGASTHSFDADIDCWYSAENKQCGSASFSKSRTYREDEFHLFNGDDEGCQITVRWSVTLSRD